MTFQMLERPMSSRPRLPWTLWLVASLFAWSGLWELYRMGWSLAKGSPHVSLAPLGLLIAVGLVLRWNLCRLMGIAWSVLGLLMIPAMALAVLRQRSVPVSVALPGWQATSASLWSFWLMLGLLLLLLLIQLRVLTQPSTKELFQPRQA